MTGTGRDHLARHAAILVNVGFIGLLVGSERTVLPLLAAEHFSVSSSTVALSFIAGFGAAKAVANLVAGRLADRRGRRTVLLAGWTCGLAVPVLLWLAPTWAWIVAANVLLGVHQGLTWTATLVAMGDLAGPRRSGTAMGANEFVGYLAIGFAAWTTGRVGAAAGLQPAVLLVAGTAAVLGLATAVPVRETLAALPSPREPAPRPVDRHGVACAVAGHVTKVIDAGVWGLVPLLLTARGLSLDAVGLVAGVYPAVWGAGQLATGALSDRLGRRDLIAAGMGLQAVGLVLLAGTAGLAGAVAAAATTGLGAALAYPTLLAAVRDAAGDHTAGAALGAYRFWRDLGFVVGALGGGVLADRLGVAAGIRTVAGVAGLTAVLVVVAVRDPVPRLGTRPVTDPV